MLWKQRKQGRGWAGGCNVKWVGLGKLHGEGPYKQRPEGGDKKKKSHLNIQEGYEWIFGGDDTVTNTTSHQFSNSLHLKFKVNKYLLLSISK